AVCAVPRNEHRLRPGSDRAAELGGEPDAGGGDFREVVAGEPEPAAPAAVTGVAREDDDPARDTLHLTQAGDGVMPVMNRRESHRGVEGLILERQALRGGSDARRCAWRTLRAHDRGRVDGGDLTV